MLISEISAATDTSERSLRYYEAHGLLAPDRDGRGRRVYSKDDLIRVRNIRTLVDAGFAVKQVGALLPCRSASFPAERLAPAAEETVTGMLARLDADLVEIERRKVVIRALFPQVVRAVEQTGRTPSALS